MSNYRDYFISKYRQKENKPLSSFQWSITKNKKPYLLKQIFNEYLRYLILIFILLISFVFYLFPIVDINKDKKSSENVNKNNALADIEVINDNEGYIEDIEEINKPLSKEEIYELIDENGTFLLENEGKIKNLFAEKEKRPEEDKNFYRKKAKNFRYHKVKYKESIWSLVKTYGVSIDSIVSLNNLRNINFLPVGKKIKIPHFSGVYHKVKHQEFPYSIAKKYKTSLTKIKQYNEINNNYLAVGDILFIPDAKLPASQRKLLFGTFFTNPVKGRISSKYGMRKHPIYNKMMFHRGIDIASQSGNNVYAAASGKVIFAGYKGGYGNYIIIRHNNGYQSAYGHLSKVLVKKGQWVKQKTSIAKVGSTGVSTGPHLHFEIKYQGKYINPKRFIRY